MTKHEAGGIVAVIDGRTRHRGSGLKRGILADALISIGLRLVIGIVVGVVLSFVGWMVTWAVLQFFSFNWGVFLMVSLPCIAGLIGLGTVFVWWNPMTPPRVTVLRVALTIGAAVLSAWIAYQMAMTNPYHTWIGRGIVFPMQLAAIAGSNLVAGVSYAFRALLRSEV